MFSRKPFEVSPAGASLLSDAFSSHAPSGSDRRTFGRPGMAGPPLSASISDPVAFGADARAAPAIMIRRLPQNISGEALGSMLLFAGDLLDTEIIRSPYQEDKGFATAVARFQTHTGALEAQQKLHGKPNTARDANMIVEIHSGNMTGWAFERRSTSDTAPTSRTQTSSASSAGSGGGPPPARSRFNGAFQTSDKISPPLPTSGSGGSAEFPIPESSSHLQNLFSPQSPVANGFGDRHRLTGKATINNDAVDDETGELLKDPIGYAKSGRRPTNPQMPVGRFGSLSLSTDNGSGTSLPSPSSNGMTSPRSTHPLQSPVSPNAGFSPLNYPRPQYPPINPADQNPPCNTLYVGNLPLDTSEDELKAIFSKQRGYKRLCFRTKQNGPMCFVEFEDISFATKALNDLYGHPLHNSVKGGIRLSFSKNPLGVRSGQHPPPMPNGLSHHGGGAAGGAVMNPHALSPGYAGAAAAATLNPAAFSSVSGPPPGLGSPPGLLSNGTGQRPNGGRSAGTGLDGMFAHPFAMSHDFTPAMHQQQQGSQQQYHPQQGQTLSGGVPPSMNASYGRDARYSDYMLGR